MKINFVIAQFSVTLSIERNLEIIDSMIERTSTGDWVIFPEGSVSGYSTDTSFLKQFNLTELIAGLEHIRNQAERRRTNIWVGACINIDGQWFNTAQGFSSNGDAQVYRKINLATHERGIFSTGSDLPVFELTTPKGKIKVGIQICWELRFPEQWGWLARCGA